MTIDPKLLAALTDDVGTQGYLKAGLLGFPKSGKTYTGAMLAAAVKTHFKLPGPVAMFDTEGGSVYIRPTLEALGCGPLLAKRARSFDDLMRWAETCIKAGVSIALVDSITHPWRELCDAYLAQVNNFRRERNWSLQKRLEFQDWNAIKPRWATWTDFYLNSPLHIVICGRAGWEYEMQDRDDGSNKKDLVKSGVKMKTESEFGFEPSLLVEMEREQVRGDRNYIARKATVLGDRFSKIDGKEIYFPSTDDPKKAMGLVFNFFKPHLDCLTPGVNPKIDTDVKTDFPMENGEDTWAHEKRQRVIFCEEIQGEIVRKYPGQTAADKQAKADLLDKVFGTRSWTKVEGMDSAKLKAGLEKIRELFGKPAPAGPPDEETMRLINDEACRLGISEKKDWKPLLAEVGAKKLEELTMPQATKLHDLMLQMETPETQEAGAA